MTFYIDNVCTCVHKYKKVINDKSSSLRKGIFEKLFVTHLRDIYISLTYIGIEYILVSMYNAFSESCYLIIVFVNLL